MIKEEWIRLNDLLVKDYADFQRDHADSTKGQTYKIRTLAARNAGFALGRVQYWICDRPGSQLLLKDYLADKPYDIEEFFQPVYFLSDMQGFLEMVKKTIASF